MSRRLFTLIVAFSMILTSAGAVLAVDAYVVGMSAALTGQGSGSYAPIKDAFDIYFKALNAKGGINGHPVKIIFSDNAAQPSKAAADAKRFATQDKVILLMNASLSSTYAPMIQVAKRYKIPIFFAGGVCPSDVYPPKPAPLEFCATGFGFRYDSQFAIPFIKETAKGPVKLALVAMNIPVSRAEMEYAATLAKKDKDFTVTGIEAIPPPTPDYTPFATKIKNAGANWVYSWAPWVTEVKTLEALRKLGWEGNYIAYCHNPAEQELERLKDDKFYVFGTNALFADNTNMHKEIKAASEKAKTIYPYQKLTGGWIFAMVLEKILKGTPWPPTPAKVQKAMTEIKVNLGGLRGGSLVWTPTNHFRTLNYYRVYKWDSKANKIKLVKDWTPIQVK
jgi:branched-chain amino acid transport system substrate-binding protein